VGTLIWTMTWSLVWLITPVAFSRAAASTFPRLADRIGMSILLQLITLGLALFWSSWAVIAAFVLIGLTLLLSAADEADDID
jgi:hypothetical protein